MSDALYDLDAEESTLGSVFFDPPIIDDVLETLTAEDFQADRHAVVFAGMRALAEQAIEVNSVNLANQLRTDGTLDRAGGVGGLGVLAMATPSSGNWRRYAKIVREYSLRRKLVAAASGIMEAARDTRQKIPDVLGGAEAAVQAVSDKTTSRRPVIFREALFAEWKELEALAERKSAMTGLPSGLTTLDDMTAGFQKTHLFIVAGRPSMGKSALAFGFAVNAALSLKPEDGVVVCFSLEMSQSELVRRIISSESRVDGGRFRDGQFGGADWPKMVRASEKLMGMPLVLDDREGLMLSEIRAELRRQKSRYGKIAMFVVDYLQIAKGDPDAENRTQEVSQLSTGFKRLAKEFNCPGIVLSQLNRKVEDRSDKRPMMSDLRESGAIEQDADVVAFVYRDEFYNKDTPDAGIAEIIIAKQRGGPTGTARVAFDKQFTLFRDLPKPNGF